MIVLTILIFAGLYAIKGGALGLVPRWSTLTKTNAITRFALDGTRLAAVLAGLFIALQVDKTTGALFALAWFIGTIPSMGEEAGAIGTYRRHWGPYLQWMPQAKSLLKLRGKEWFVREGVTFGWKKGAQRGVWMGASLALATQDTAFIWAGLAFPLCHFAGQSLYYAIHKDDSWAYAEPLIGAVFGIAAAHWMGV